MHFNERALGELVLFVKMILSSSLASVFLVNYGIVSVLIAGSVGGASREVGGDSATANEAGGGKNDYGLIESSKQMGQLGNNDERKPGRMQR